LTNPRAAVLREKNGENDMFETTTMLYCAYVAAMASSTGLYNIIMKTGAAGLAAWAAMHSAAYWGIAV